MALKAQKAPITDPISTSEEQQQETTAQSTEGKPERRSKNTTNSKKTAQKQQDAQPGAEKLLQVLIQMDAPKAPEAEDDDVRRVSNEFVLRWSPEALEHVKAKASDFVRLVNSSAYARIYLAEAILCGSIAVIPIGRVAPIEAFDKWWTAFKVGDLWFVLRYHDTQIREYELVPAFGPTPGDGGPAPTQTRQQRRPAPQRIGPRPRRNRGDAQGSRSSAVGKKIKAAAKGAKKKIDGAKRAIIELAQNTFRELGGRCASFAEEATHLWRQFKPRIQLENCDLRSIHGNALQTYRLVLATFVQIRQEAIALAKPVNSSFTGVDDGATETYGPSGQLEQSYAGHGVFRRLELKSWRWINPPIAWDEYPFGVDWSLDIFGPPEEEQAFT